MSLTIDQLREAVRRERQMSLKYTLAKSPALAKFYQKQAEKYEAQLSLALKGAQA